MTEILSHPIPAVVIMLGMLVFVHELGHFLVGRWAGIAVEMFSIGFGPKVLGWSYRGTEYRLGLLPLGGFVKFAGAHSSEEVPRGLSGIAFRDAALWKRSLTIVAGPLANFLLAIVGYSVLGFYGIPHPPALIGEVLPESAAEVAGVIPGDRFVTIDGQVIKTWRDLEKIISGSPDKNLKVEVDRKGEIVTLHLTPSAVKGYDLIGRETTVGRAGVALGKVPAIISVTDANSPAAKAGLKTGYRILEVSNEKKQWQTPGLSELKQAFEDALQSNESKILRMKVIADAEKKPTNPPTEINLDLEHLTKPNALRGRELLQAVGIMDAQLAVLEANESLAQVLQTGDVFTHWQEKPISTIFALREALLANQYQQVKVTVIRDFKALNLDLTLKPIEVQKIEGPATVYMLPVAFMGQPEEPAAVYEKYESPLLAVRYGFTETGLQTQLLVKNVLSLITGEIPLKSLGGPMLIAKVAGDSAKRGWQTFLSSMALISINLGILNMFPIPVLDGGQLLLLSAEALRRRPLKEAAIENFQKIGFALILALVILATYNDFSRFWRSMIASVSGMFG